MEGSSDEAEFVPAVLGLGFRGSQKAQLNYSLNSLKGGDIGGCIGDYKRGY